MQNNFTRGLLIGGIIGASLSMIVNPKVSNRTKRKLIKNGRSVLRKSNSLIGDLVEIFR